MVRPMFTRRFWSANQMISSAYELKKPSDGYGSHDNSKRLGFHQVEDAYNVSVPRTDCHGSEEEIIANNRGQLPDERKLAPQGGLHGEDF
jgi:hypothetical protein